jgi:hypothetical protein
MGFVSTLTFNLGASFLPVRGVKGSPRSAFPYRLVNISGKYGQTLTKIRLAQAIERS